jgi:hypothetical protein
MKWLCLAAAMIWTQGVGRAASDAERIAQLELRVQQLEAALSRLLMAQGGPALALPPPAPAEAPAPEPARQSESPALPQELLPNLGKIGANVSFLSGTGSGTGGFGRDRFWGGSAQLPLVNLPGGKLSYELVVGVLQYDRSPEQTLRLLEIQPFGLVYATELLDRFRLRPYVGAGLGNYVTLVASPAAGARLGVGVRFEGGVEWRFSRNVGLGLDIRHNWADHRFQYTTIGPRAMWHF